MITPIRDNSNINSRYRKNFRMKSVIYKLVCKDPNVLECYVGSTRNFVMRRHLHKSDSKNEESIKGKYKLYQKMREAGGWNNWNMEILEECPEPELIARERWWYDKLQPSLNVKVPNRCKKESNKAHYEKNRERITQFYRQQYESSRVDCECGKKVAMNRLESHISTQLHKKNIERLKGDAVQNKEDQPRVFCRERSVSPSALTQAPAPFGCTGPAHCCGYCGK